MAISFHSVLEPASAADSLRSEPLLSPPLSPSGSEDVPYKASESDRISLSMKRSKNNMRRWPRPFAQIAFASDHTHGRRRRWGRSTGRKPGSLIDSTPIRRSRSMPAVHAHSVSGIPKMRTSLERTRRWTVASKAAPTRGLATIAPVRDTSSRRSARKSNPSQSPAMITLRRATTGGSPTRLSLTSFPPPKFHRESSGFLLSFLNSITGQDEYQLDISAQAQSAKDGDRRLRPPSTGSNAARPSTSTIAPPVHTEVVATEQGFPIPGQSYAMNSARRCSTRYVSDDVTYEIIWDENASSANSDNAIPSPADTASPPNGTNDNGTEDLEGRLSKVLSQSRRGSSSAQRSRRTSYWPGSETFSQGLLPLLASPKLARLTREAALRSLPRSKAAKATERMSLMASYADVTQQVLLDPLAREGGDENVQFFPPLSSRANVPPSECLDPMPISLPGAEPQAEASNTPFTGSHYEEWQNRRASNTPFTDSQYEEWQSRRASNRRGSMVGISSHKKRLSVSADGLPGSQRIKDDLRRGSEGGKRPRSSDDEARPLLMTS